MLRSTKRLFGLPVQTVGGINLGQVTDLEIETDTGRLQKMRVKPSGLVKGLMNQELIIDWSQIQEIKEEVILVDDSAVKEKSKASVRSASPATMVMASDLPEAE